MNDSLEGFGAKVKQAYVKGVEEDVTNSILAAAQMGRTNYSTELKQWGTKFIAELASQGVTHRIVGSNKVVFDWSELLGTASYDEGVDI